MSWRLWIALQCRAAPRRRPSLRHPFRNRAGCACRGGTAWAGCAAGVSCIAACAVEHRVVLASGAGRPSTVNIVVVSRRRARAGRGARPPGCACGFRENRPRCVRAPSRSRLSLARAGTTMVNCRRSQLLSVCDRPVAIVLRRDAHPVSRRAVELFSYRRRDAGRHVPGGISRPPAARHRRRASNLRRGGFAAASSRPCRRPRPAQRRTLRAAPSGRRWRSCSITVGRFSRAVDHRVVLDVGAVADFDRSLVAAQNRAKPDARAGTDLDVSDEDGGGRDVGVWDGPSGAFRRARTPLAPIILTSWCSSPWNDTWLSELPPRRSRRVPACAARCAIAPCAPRSRPWSSRRGAP